MSEQDFAAVGRQRESSDVVAEQSLHRLQLAGCQINYSHLAAEGICRQNVAVVKRDLLERCERQDLNQAAEMEMRSLLLMALGRWLANGDMTQTEAAKVLGITQARVSDIKRGKISQFSLDLLVRMASRAGLEPKLKLAA